MSEVALKFITEQMIEKIDILDIKMDAKVTLAKELGKVLSKVVEKAPA